MHSTFNFSRWFLLVGRHWAEHKRTYLLALASLAGLFIVWFLISVIGRQQAPDESLQEATFYFGLVVIGCLYASIFFTDLASKTKGLNLLMIPASHLEKLLSAILYTVVVFFVCYTAIFYLIDVLMVKAGNAVALAEWKSPGGVRWKGDEFHPVKVINVFWSLPNSRGHFKELGYVLLAYFALQASFLCGSVYFGKMSLLKTFISLSVIGLLLAFVLGKIVFPLLPEGGFGDKLTTFTFYSGDVDVSTAMHGVGKGYTPHEGSLEHTVSLPQWLSAVIFFIAKFAFAPLFWLATYYRLREKQL